MWSNCLQIQSLILILTTLILLACPWQSSAQGKLEGTVTDQDKRPLANVVIVIETTTATSPYPEIAPLTNEEGRFTFPSLPVGEYTLRAATDGYQTQTHKVVVKAGTSSSVAFVLTRNPTSD